MSLAVVFLSETFAAKWTLKRFDLLVHLQDVLVQISFLRESAFATWVVANEGFLLGVGTHVVEELGRVGHQPVAATAVLALEEPKRVDAVSFLLKLKHDVTLALW